MNTPKMPDFSNLKKAIDGKDRDRAEMQAEISQKLAEDSSEMLRRHDEIVSELRNLVTAVKELTELIRNTR